MTVRSAFFVVPGPVDSATGGFIYDRRIASGLRELGWRIELCELGGAYPIPSHETLRCAAALFTSLPDGASILVDGLAYGAMPDVVRSHAMRLRFIPVVHLPQGCDPTLDAEMRQQREASERAALQQAALVVVTGRCSIDVVAGYGVPSWQIALVEPGSDPMPIASGSGGVVHILCVATVNEIKGHDILVDALDRMRDLPWRATCVGSLMRDPAAATRLEGLVDAADLSDRVRLTGELRGDCLERCYREADLFALATRFETYGMAAAEALAHGLPVVSTQTGALPTLVGDEAGILVPVGETRAFGDALRRVTGDAALRRTLREGAIRARARLNPWTASAEAFSRLLTRVATGG